jgi:hypothetical protein
LATKKEKKKKKKVKKKLFAERNAFFRWYLFKLGKNTNFSTYIMEDLGLETFLIFHDLLAVICPFGYFTHSHLVHFVVTYLVYLSGLGMSY